MEGRVERERWIWRQGRTVRRKQVRVRIIFVTALDQLHVSVLVPALLHFPSPTTCS